MIPQTSHNDPTIIPWSSHYRERASHWHPTFVLGSARATARDRFGYGLMIVGTSTLVLGAAAFVIGGLLWI